MLPGDCHIEARPPGGGPLSQLGFTAAYYPKADTIDNAQLVQIKAGAETSNINLTLRYSVTYTIEVKVLDDGTAAEDNAYLISVSGVAPNTLAAGFPTLAREDGTAELRGIPNGTYTIRVNRGQVRIARNGQRLPSGGGPVVGSATVQVMDGDLSVTIPISSFPPPGRQ